MKKFLLLSVAATLISSLSFATIRRVGFFGPAVAGVDYATFQLAHDASSAGDTIMMQPGSSFGYPGTMTQKLVVIGPGYFLNQNANLQANTLGMDSVNGSLDIANATANGSSFIGCTFPASTCKISGTGIQNVSFLHCWFFGSSSQNPGINILNNVNNFLFQQCVFKDYGLMSYQSNVVCTNLSFVNCLFYSSNGGGYGLYFNDIANTGLIQNCVLAGDNGSNNFVLYGTWAVNNAIGNPNQFVGSGITVQNSICTNTQFPAGNGNKQNQTWANIFTLSGSTDGQYTLKAGSPAIGAGIGGTNCGIFGGATPYRLSGIPSVPTIYALTSPQGGHAYGKYRSNKS